MKGVTKSNILRSKKMISEGRIENIDIGEPRNEKNIN
jgi:hypothetical protein